MGEPAPDEGASADFFFELVTTGSSDETRQWAAAGRPPAPPSGAKIEGISDLFENSMPRIWPLSDTRIPARRDVIALYNWDSEEIMIEYSMDKIGLDGKRRYHAFDFWGNELLPPIQRTLHIAVPAQSCRILALRAACDNPQLLSTSRHVTQGIVDVVEERWDASRNALLGRSKVVANDSYELRVIIPAVPKVWKLKSEQASASSHVHLVEVIRARAKARPHCYLIVFTRSGVPLVNKELQ